MLPQGRVDECDRGAQVAPPRHPAVSRVERVDGVALGGRDHEPAHQQRLAVDGAVKGRGPCAGRGPWALGTRQRRRSGPHRRGRRATRPVPASGRAAAASRPAAADDTADEGGVAAPVEAGAVAAGADDGPAVSLAVAGTGACGDAQPAASDSASAAATSRGRPLTSRASRGCPCCLRRARASGPPPWPSGPPRLPCWMPDRVQQRSWRRCSTSRLRPRSWRCRGSSSSCRSSSSGR